MPAPVFLKTCRWCCSAFLVRFPEIAVHAIDRATVVSFQCDLNGAASCRLVVAVHLFGGVSGMRRMGDRQTFSGDSRRLRARTVGSRGGLGVLGGYGWLGGRPCPSAWRDLG